jgi:hypothetical protein
MFENLQLILTHFEKQTYLFYLLQKYGSYLIKNSNNVSFVGVFKILDDFSFVGE